MTKNSIFIICLLFLATLFCADSMAQDAPGTTTIYIVRHADRDGANDALTDVGRKRAQQLSQLMQHLRITDVYSTETQRTQNTAKPTADLLELNVQPYGELSQEWYSELKANHVGSAILIVGHSNTSGQIANGLGGEGDFTMDEDEYDGLFVVSIDASGTKAIRLRYGEANDHEKSDENGDHEPQTSRSR